jgi:hypothetical protein
MILLTLLGTFMAFTGIILHTMSKLINENKKKVNPIQVNNQTLTQLHELGSYEIQPVTKAFLEILSGKIT